MSNIFDEIMPEMTGFNNYEMSTFDIDHAKNYQQDFDAKKTNNNDEFPTVAFDDKLDTFPLELEDNFDVCTDIDSVLDAADNDHHQDPKTHFLNLVKRSLSQVSLALVDRIFKEYDSNTLITKNEVLRFMKHYFRGRLRKQNPDAFIEERNVLYAAFGYLIAHHPSNQSQTMISYESLIHTYPEIDEELFNATDEQKLSLVNYYFYLNIIQPILKTSTKSLLIDVPSLLEGSGREYILGSRQSHDTEARVILATNIGQLTVHRRKHNRNENDNDNDDDDNDEDDDDNNSEESSLPAKKRNRKSM